MNKRQILHRNWTCKFSRIFNCVSTCKFRSSRWKNVKNTQKKWKRCFVTISCTVTVFCWKFRWAVNWQKGQVTQLKRLTETGYPRGRYKILKKDLKVLLSPSKIALGLFRQIVHSKVGELQSIIQSSFGWLQQF